MYYETAAVDLTGVNLLSDHLGGGWDYFQASITPENAKRFINAYNLLSLNSDWAGDEDEEDNNWESTLSLEIQHVIVDESLTVPEQTQQIRVLLLNNIIDRLVKIGLVLDLDHVKDEHFDLLLELYDLIFVIYQYEDLSSIGVVLEQTDIPAVDRYLELLRKVKGFEPSDIEPLYYIITEVEENLLETLNAGLIHPDAAPDTPESIIKRVKLNKKFLLDECLAGDHIKGNGQVGMGIHSLRSFYRPELTAILDQSPVEFVRQVIGMTLISSLTDEEITPYIAEVIKAECDEIDVYYRAEAIMKEIKLDGVTYDGD